MHRSDQHGFTLIEVLVALVLVSIMTLLAWRGLEGLGRAGEQTTRNEQGLQRIQTGLAQWSADLDALTDVGMSALQPLDFDGQRLRLTRRSSQPNAGVMVVAWTLRASDAGMVWQRWASTPLTDQQALQDAWQTAERWSRTPLAEDAKFVVTFMPVSGWQLFYSRDGTWSNPLSAADKTATGNVALPDGVQLVLDLPAGSGAGLSGKLTRYWLQPTLGATK
ncbi:MAG: prepilin-type N-terminal cleavage/methylation domain-containing protein [Cytophagales bacterium]|nr:prepilin-type N-terminal cleavage/methylation domain-containing protein [Cytophagales bacterium]